ncbi:MAG: DinB family protein [Chitinophagaceae bacterium]|jgi:hypothetical protein|nr:DinB family protein [Chitinophagaceae bacterium]
MEKDFLEEFTDTTNNLIELLSSLTEKQLNAVPFEGSWTAGQVGHHLSKSFGIVVILGGKTIPTNRPETEKINSIREVFQNTGIKMESPEFIIPTTKWIEKEKLIRGLREKISAVKNFIDNHTDLSLTCLDFELPGAGPLTQKEWILFMAIHTQRHIHQLQNIIKIITVK